jgi:hypothetical protein
MFHIFYNPNETLPETFYKINTGSDFCKKIRSVKKKTNKTQKNCLEVGFFRRFFGFYWAGFLLPTLFKTCSLYRENGFPDYNLLKLRNFR